MTTTTQVALVTGANKGLGYEIARRLGAQRMTVVVGTRHRGRGEKAAAALVEQDVDAHFVHLDVTDQASVDAAAAEIDHRWGRLDVLVNNAGVSVEDGHQPTATTAEQMAGTYATNVFGVVTVTAAMVPLLRRSSAARIVMMSSAMGSLALWSDPTSPLRRFAPQVLAYNSSKTALNALTVAYANALADQGIKVNAADPGYVATDLNGHSGYRSVEQGAEIAVRLATLDTDGPSGAFLSEDGPVPW